MLNEYALRFNAMLEQSSKLDALEWQEKATAASLPYMEEDARQQLMASYEENSYDIVEALRESPDDIETIKGAFDG